MLCICSTTIIIIKLYALTVSDGAKIVCAEGRPRRKEELSWKSSSPKVASVECIRLMGMLERQYNSDALCGILMTSSTLSSVASGILNQTSIASRNWPQMPFDGNDENILLWGCSDFLKFCCQRPIDLSKREKTEATKLVSLIKHIMERTPAECWLLAVPDCMLSGFVSIS